jgi:hypothetical protein
MRRLIVRSALTVALAACLALPAAPAHAAQTTLFECDLDWAGTGALYCEYVATSTRGHAEAVIEDPYYTTLNVDCAISGSGGWIGQTGSIDYNQIPGEVCGVLLLVRREAGSADTWAGSVL